MRPLTSYDWTSIASNARLMARIWLVDVLLWLVSPLVFAVLLVDAWIYERRRGI